MRKKLKLLATVMFFIGCPLVHQANALSAEFIKKIDALVWVAYSPTHYNPERNLYPSREDIQKDLETLALAGFNGLVTYGAQSTLGEIPELARKGGFQGVIMGIWDIYNESERANAILSADYVDGYCVGNEGLYKRYSLEDLNKIIGYMKERTGKPVTTTEEYSDYCRENILTIGDWVFPNIHPFLSHITTAKTAADWIAKHYRIIRRNALRYDKLVCYKEVGCPTRGSRLNSRTQKDFFISMSKAKVKFMYFEAFDQYWKDYTPIEPYWGLFDKNRKPKLYIAEQIKKRNAISESR